MKLICLKIYTYQSYFDSFIIAEILLGKILLQWMTPIGNQIFC